MWMIKASRQSYVLSGRAPCGEKRGTEQGRGEEREVARGRASGVVCGASIKITKSYLSNLFREGLEEWLPQWRVRQADLMFTHEIKDTWGENHRVSVENGSFRQCETFAAEIRGCCRRRKRRICGERRAFLATTYSPASSTSKTSFTQHNYFEEGRRGKKMSGHGKDSEPNVEV